MKIEIYCKYNKQTYPAIDMRNFTSTKQTEDKRSIPNNQRQKR